MNNDTLVQKFLRQPVMVGGFVFMVFLFFILAACANSNQAGWN